MLLQVQIYPVDGNNVSIVGIGDHTNKLKLAAHRTVLSTRTNITSCFYFWQKQKVNFSININSSLFTFGGIKISLWSKSCTYFSHVTMTSKKKYFVHLASVPSYYNS